VEPRQSLARLSAVDGNGNVFLDDYIVQTEPVVDFKTRFSGLIGDELDIRVSPHYLISLRTAYLKIRYLVDKGCIFVGHGLKTDFQVVNVFVPPSQVVASYRPLFFFISYFCTCYISFRK
jgi:PAB-dependent poly(A)-specific ribonuclease subunit 2